MLGIGQNFPAFNLKATVSNDIKKAFTDITNTGLQGQMAGLFAGQGLHLCLSDRNRRIRQTEQANSRTATRRCSA